METAKRSIVLFADVLEEGFDGVSVTLHKILKYIPRDRFRVLIITAHPPKDLSAFSHEIVLCPYLKVPFQKGYRIGLPKYKDIQQRLDEFKPDLIHFTSPSLFAIMALRYGRKKGIPVLNIYHTHYPEYLKYYIGTVGTFLFGRGIKYLFGWFYRRSNLTLVPTKPIKKDLIKLGVKKQNLKIWGRSIESGAFRPDYREADHFDLVVPADHKKVLFVSRLIKEKETKTIYKVYKKLLKADQNITLIITGDGPRRDWLERKMPKAIFTGKKKGESLSKIYASSDVFFFPSASETFGNVIIEAMASGLPVVSANAGGPAELIHHNKTGFLIETGKAKEFCEKILLLINDDELRSRMGQNAINYVKSRPIEILHNQLWLTYERLIENFKREEKVIETTTIDSPKSAQMAGA